MPAIFGRRAARSAQASSIESALGNIQGARTNMATVTGPMRDARDAVDELALQVQAASSDRWQLYSIPLAKAREAALQVQRQLVHAADLADLPATELLDGMRALHADPRSTDHAWRVIAMLARERPDDLGAAAPLLAELGSSPTRQRLANALIDDAANLDAAWHGMVDATRIGTVRARNLQQAFADAARRSGADGADAAPEWLTSFAPDELVRLTAEQASELRLLAGANTRDQVAEQLLATLRRERLDKDDLRFLRTAADLPDHLRVRVPLPDGAPTLDEMIGVETSGPYLAHVAQLHDAYVRLATSSDAILAGEVTRLGAGHVTPHGSRLLARLGVERPDVVLGPTAASKPWAMQLLTDALDSEADWSRVAALRDAIGFVRRTDGDRARILAEVERLANAPDLERLPADLRQVGHALRVLPDAARPTGTSALQPMLDQVFYGRDMLAPKYSSAHVHERFRNGLRMIVEGARLADDPTVTRASVLAELDELLARPLDQLDDDTMRRIAVLSSLPEHLRPRTDELFAPLARATGNSDRSDRAVVDWMRMLRAGDHIAADPGTTRATTAAELRRIVELPREQLTRGDVRRALELAHVPGDASPIVGRTPHLLRGGLQSVAGIGNPRTDPTEWAGLSQVAREELDQLLMSVERAEVLEAGATPDSVRRELRSLLATDTGELTPHALRRIAVLDGMPRELRGYDAPVMRGTRDGVAGGWREGMSATSRSEEFDLPVALRLLDVAVEAGDHAAASSRTADQLTTELARLLSRANDQLTPEQQRRIAVIASMPDELRPRLPVPPMGMSLAEVAARDVWRAGYGRDSLDAVRQAILPSSDVTVDELVALARQADGSIRLDAIAPSARPRITGASPAELERLGISPQSLLRDILEATDGSGDKHRVHQAIHDAIPIATRLRVDTPGEQRVLDRLRESLQRNLDRGAGRLIDGYGRHPDYAEHGRSIADAVLLGRMDDLRRSRAAQAVTTDAASEAVETLTW